MEILFRLLAVYIYTVPLKDDQRLISFFSGWQPMRYIHPVLVYPRGGHFARDLQPLVLYPSIRLPNRFYFKWSAVKLSFCVFVHPRPSHHACTSRMFYLLFIFLEKKSNRKVYSRESHNQTCRNVYYIFLDSERTIVLCVFIYYVFAVSVCFFRFLNRVQKKRGW